MERASNLRMIALATAVAFIALMPLAGASAGPPSGSDGGLLNAVPVLGADSGQTTGDASDQVAEESGDLRQTATCGPRLTSPEGLRAQTCTLSEDGDTWARTYYRNATGDELSGVLTLMRPDGRTVQVNCPIAAGKEAGSCETPHERNPAGDDGPEDTYVAVAEIARQDADRLLLRAGSGQ